MKVVSVCGITKSGKTTTIEHIIAELRRRRYSVGSVKDIHFEQFAMDKPGTNTWRHREAGSQLVTARGPGETDVLFQSRLSIPEILRFYDHDWVVLEGSDDACVPLIVCGHNTGELDRLIDGRTIAISGVAAAELESYRGLPALDATTATGELVDLLEERVPRLLPGMPGECCGLCGMTCEELLVEIVAGRRTRDDCRLDRGEVHLTIGGREIEMVPFVRRVLGNTLVALVSTLDGYRPGREIVVRLEGRTDD